MLLNAGDNIQLNIVLEKITPPPNGDYHTISLTSGWNYNVIWDGPDYMPVGLAVSTLSSFYRITTPDGELAYGVGTNNSLESLRFGTAYSIMVTQAEDWVVPDPNDDYLPEWEIPEEPPWVEPSEYLPMNKETLFPHLVHHHVSHDWWELTKQQRRELALHVIQWFSADYFDAKALAYGGENCSEPPVGGILDVCPGPQCITKGLGMEFHSALRYSLFTKHVVYPTNIYFYDGRSESWKCGYHPYDFKLPTCMGMGEEYLNCIQIDSDLNQLSSWIFFQSQMIDGSPGCDPDLWPGTLGYIDIYANDIRVDTFGVTRLNHATMMTRISY